MENAMCFCSGETGETGETKAQWTQHDLPAWPLRSFASTRVISKSRLQGSNPQRSGDFLRTSKIRFIWGEHTLHMATDPNCFWRSRSWVKGQDLAWAITNPVEWFLSTHQTTPLYILIATVVMISRLHTHSLSPSFCNFEKIWIYI